MAGLTGDILSGIAIIISILGTILSIIYTKQSVGYSRKQFEADFYPHLILQVLERSGGTSGLKTCLSFRLTNQSADRMATNVRLRASLSHPKWHWRLRSIKWYQFFEKSGFNLAPSEIKETHPASHGYHADDLEKFLLDTFPKIVYPETDPETPEDLAFTEEVDFILRVQVIFQPPISRAADMRQDFYYKLTPKFRKNNGNPYCLNFWDIQFLKAC